MVVLKMNKIVCLCVRVFLFFKLLLFHSGLACKLVVVERSSREDINHYLFYKCGAFHLNVHQDRKYFHAVCADGETETQTSCCELASYLAPKWLSNAAPLPDYQSSAPTGIFPRCRRISEEKNVPSPKKTSECGTQARSLDQFALKQQRIIQLPFSIWDNFEELFALLNPSSKQAKTITRASENDV